MVESDGAHIYFNVDDSDDVIRVESVAGGRRPTRAIASISTLLETLIYKYVLAILSPNGLGVEKVKNDQNQNDEPKRSRKSSEYIRVVGEQRIEVVNTKQRPDDVPKKARDKKWAVIVTVPTKSGGWRKLTVSTNDRKSDAIRALLDKEIALKAAAQESD
mgnify:CR=1 FL=1